MDDDTLGDHPLGGPAVARIWRGATRKEDSGAHRDALRADLRAVRSVEGNIGVLVLERRADGRTEFLFVSFWESMHAVVGFAGPDVDRAVYFRDDASVLLEMPSRVDHLEIVAAKVDLSS